MNEKLKFVNFFVDTGKISERQVAPEYLAEFLPGLVFVYQLGSKKIGFSNLRFKEFLGHVYQTLPFSEDSLKSIVLPDDLPFLQNFIDQIVRQPRESQQSIKCRLLRADNEFRWFKINVSILPHESDESIHSILFFAEDIHDVVEQEKIDKVRNELLDTIEDQLQFGCWTYDVQTQEVTWTAGISRLLGYEPSEVGKPDPEFYLQHVLPGDKHALRKVMLGKSIDDFNIEHIVKTKTGSEKILISKGKIVCDDYGQVKKLIGIVHDITSVRNFEREQARSIRELNRSNKELEEFAYVASHDLQEPLRKISMFTERLRSKFLGNLDKEGQLFMDRILVSADNMKVLIDNLLEFSRANRASQEFSELDLNNVLTEVLSNFELKIEELNAEVIIEPALPCIQAESSQMQQLFMNLISNAIKFRKSTVAPIVKISSRVASADELRQHQLTSAGRYYVIDFCDNGIGFEQQYAERIFQIFQRLHGKSEYPGSGIGLAICKKIVENHNGKIVAHSSPEIGSTFTIILPEKQI
jgi:PAS domain S-box-containing protein